MEENLKPEREIIWDQKQKVYRMCWVLESTCHGCGIGLENIFHERPGKTEILEALVFPCEKCMAKLERQYRREIKSSKKFLKPCKQNQM